MRNWYQSSRKRLLRLGLQVLCVLVLIFSLVQLGSYAWDAISVKKQQDDLSAAYHLAAGSGEDSQSQSEEKPEDRNQPTAAPEPTGIPAFEAAATSEPQPAVVPTVNPGSTQKLPAVTYPNNPYATYNEAFSSLRKMNPDIMAWLTVEELLDSAVVLRDNTYYLTRDFTGKNNVNGALFLDEQTKFYRNQRPYTFVIYGHNMKTGGMFGSLKKFTKDQWYYHHPFVTFNTLYEDGEYVIFSVATVNVANSSAWNYVNYYNLYSDRQQKRLECMNRLRTLSSYYNRVDLRGDDQILLLVTCNGNDDERLIISARRFREGDSREVLQRFVP